MGGLAVGIWPAFTLEKTYWYYSKVLPDSLSTPFSSYLSLLRWNFCLQEKNLILFTTMYFMPKKGDLGWKQESTKVVFSDRTGKAGMYKRARRKVNNNKGEGKELSTLGSSKFNIKNIF